jgi:hypothetical protein
MTAVSNADGTVTFRCSHGLDAASRTFSAAHGKPSREVRHDR